MPKFLQSRLSTWLFAAALFTSAELITGLYVGQFALRGRAEPTLFIAFRPWLLLLLVLALSHRSAKLRWPAYALALLVASVSEGLLAWQLGAPFPGEETVRAMAAGAALLILLDLIIHAARRLWPSRARLLGAALGFAVLALPGPVRLFEAIALPPVADTRRETRVALLTGLPLVWGESDVHSALTAAGQPAQAYDLLARHFTMRPIDALPADGLRKGEVLLLAQPRPLSAYDLVALDTIVRRGGRAVFLLDPVLQWPSALALGDPRRPPATSLAEPLLEHWGLSLLPPAAGGQPVDRSLYVMGRPHRVRVQAPGQLVAKDARCRVAARGLTAECRIGRGRAIIVADADLLHDRLWVAPGLYGASREARLADNAHYVGDLISELAGSGAFAPGEAIRWADPMKSHATALLGALLLPGACLVGGLWTAARQRRSRRPIRRKK